MTREERAELLNVISFASLYLNRALRRHSPKEIAQAADYMLRVDDPPPNADGLTLIRDGARALGEAGEK